MNTLLRLLVLPAVFASITLAGQHSKAQTTEPHAATHSHETFELPLTTGHGLFDITAAFFNINNKDQQSAFAAADAEIFVLDGLSVGGGAQALWSSFEKKITVSLSPSASYYFLTQEKWSPFLNQRIIWNTDNGTFRGATALGVAYFLNPHVAISPRLAYDYNIGDQKSGPFISQRREALNFIAGLSFFF